MMEIEAFWNNVPHFSKNEKGSRGRINYGCVQKRKDITRNQKRKAYRHIRKYGFDLSETWSLDHTIMRWMSDTFGGFWRICGCSDNWNDYDLEGNYHDYWKERDNDGYHEQMRMWEVTRYESFLAHLKDFLDNASPEDFKKLSEFCCPRLRKLAEITHGWPAGEDFRTFEEWQAEIYNMADKLEEGTYSEWFVKYFFSLWD